MKIDKKVLIAILVVLVLILIILMISFINHKIKLKQEEKLFNTNNLKGKIVNINNHNINVYISGNENSEITLVFMSGAGTCSPTLDFKTLFTLYENEYRIAVVEKAGYGFSDISHVSRDIDTMLSETREALNKVGIENNNYILFPHSMSGIEALYWANKYPNEVKAIIGLDAAVPKAYENMKINKLVYQISQFGANIGITRFIPSIVESSAAIKYGNLTEEEKELYKIIFYKRTATSSMFNEVKEVKENAVKLANIDNTNIPMIFFISNGDGTGYQKDEWQSFGIDYINSKEDAKYVLLNCSHYVHDIEYQKIYEESLNFISEIER